MAHKSKKCVFLCYEEPSKMGYRLWDLEARKIVCSNDVFFNEDKMHKKHVSTIEICRVIFEEDRHVHKGVQNVGQVGQNAPHVHKEFRGDEHNIEAQPVVRWSSRVSRALDWYAPSLDYVMLTDCKEPSCYKEAFLREDKLKWDKAM